MRPTYSHIALRARQVILALCISLSLSAHVTDRELFDAYQRQDMAVWKQYVDKNVDLLYEYGYCGYIVSENKEEAKPYVARFRHNVETLKGQLHKGHYEMYMSAVYVYELRLKTSIHPVKAMSLAKEATKLAPNDPLVLAYYGTCLFYAPKPFGSKSEALKWFELAQTRFQSPQWKYCWVREATDMYIRQCHEKLEKH